jgi:hypothetical protein
LASHFQMTSPLSRDELVATLRGEIDSPWTFFGKKPVVGRVSNTRIWLVQRHNYRNSFQTVLAATLADDGGGTRLSCRTGMSAFVIVFMCVWFGLTMLIAIPITNIAIQNHDAWSVLFNAGFLAFGAGLVSLGRWLARGEREFLVSFLEDVVDARG